MNKEEAIIRDQMVIEWYRKLSDELSHIECCHIKMAKMRNRFAKKSRISIFIGHLINGHELKMYGDDDISTPNHFKLQNIGFSHLFLSTKLFFLILKVKSVI